MKIFINQIVFNRSLIDGPGLRTLVFLQGCDIHCLGCQNPSTWNIKKGIPMDVKSLAEELKKNCINRKVTITGGEPLMQKDAVLQLCKELRDFDIALYTGHDIKDVPKEIMGLIKYLKYGPLKENQKTSITPYMGSTNQVFMKVR